MVPSSLLNHVSGSGEIKRFHLAIVPKISIILTTLLCGCKNQNVVYLGLAFIYGFEREWASF